MQIDLVNLALAVAVAISAVYIDREYIRRSSKLFFFFDSDARSNAAVKSKTLFDTSDLSKYTFETHNVGLHGSSVLPDLGQFGVMRMEWQVNIAFLFR